MAKWKLSRLLFGNDVFELSEGDKVTIGRGLDNKITLASLVISRNHCLIDVKKDEVSITDLKSANGVYVGLKKILPNVPYSLTEADEIGLGWAEGTSLAKVDDDQKYVFKLEKCFTPMPDRIKFQDDVLDIIEAEIAAFDAMKTKPATKSPSPVSESKLQLKRKLSIKVESDENSTDEVGTGAAMVDDIINIISDSETETNNEQEVAVKKIKLEPDIDNVRKTTCENVDFQCEAFNVKQEYFSYNEEPVEINSDSDSDSEHWIRRLSQSSPGKPLKYEPREKTIETEPADGSYSQVDDIFEIPDDEDEDEFERDIISIPLIPPVVHVCDEDNNSDLIPKQTSSEIIEKPDIQPENIVPGANLIEDITATQSDSLKNIPNENNTTKEVENVSSNDALDSINGMNSLDNTDITGTSETSLQPNNNKMIKMTQIIQPLNKKTKRISHSEISSHKRDLSESRSKHSRKSTKAKKRSPSPKRKISNSKKEERKKKLKEIACKDKDVEETHKDVVNNTAKPVINVKVTASNRGAFLTDVNHATVKPTKRKTSPLKGKEKSKTELQRHELKSTSVKLNISSKFNEPVLKETKDTCEQKQCAYEDKSETFKFRGVVDSDSRIPFKSLKPLTESEESCLGKPVSIVEPLPPKKPKKSVSFSSAPPQVYEFEIEPGNKMRKTSSVKTTLLDAHNNTQPSLEKLMLLKILRWNPHWLIEQMNISEPPPILGHRNGPVPVFHSFNSHKDYARVIGDLLLMEIWECITQAFNTNKENKFQFRIETCPWEPSVQDRHIQFTNMSVNLSLPPSEFRRVPRVGDLLTLEYGPENDRSSRFAYVHNTRQIPQPPNGKNALFSIMLHVAFTDKMRMLKPGGEITGRSLGYIKNELTLFEAIEYMKSSPLREAILRPEPEQYQRLEINCKIHWNSPWTKELNPSQKLAVSNSVSAALGERPGVQMVQGPPGTGKSSVICAIVMTYFYDASGKKQQNRDKILICATSNAAVDGLVIRLLKIRQELPKSERFRMVRVGRLESMHERAADVSSQRLAQRDAERAQAEGTHPGASEEISRLEAKINMWKTAQRDAKNPERAAYCQGRVTNLQERLALIRSGSAGASGPVAGERLVQAERRTIEGADIIVTTLASAHNYKMKGLKGRIALCVVDEAGQAIEPETLIPLTLDVTRLTLVGDPQQLPGYICSQLAKKQGLGESLFARLSSCAEQWSASPVVLLERQYRMHGAIAEYPNRAFYDGRVRSEPPPATSLAGPPYVVLGIASGDKGQVSGANEQEAWGVARVAAALAREARARRLSLAVITPYAAHRDLLRRLLDALLHAPGDARVEVNTVDSFQGQERDVVVVSLARSSGVGFLTDAGRMNVMLTRARHQLVVCLNPMAFVRNNQWQTLIDDARRRNLYRTLPHRFCQPTTPGPASSDSILSYVFNP